LNPYASYGASTSSGNSGTEVSPGVEETQKAGRPPQHGDASKSASGQGVASGDNPVEEALVKAIGEASAAGRWDVVAQLARELEARRSARADVIDLAARRRLR
jgi:hypothetical protein